MFLRPRASEGLYRGESAGECGLGAGLVFSSVAGGGAVNGDGDATLGFPAITYGLIHQWPGVDGYPIRYRSDSNSNYVWSFRPSRQFGTGPFTVAGYGSYISQANAFVVLGNNKTASLNGFRLYVNFNGSATSSGAAAIYTYDGAATAAGANSVLLPFGRMYWLIGLRRPDGTLELWVNHRRVATSTGTVRNVDNPGSTEIRAGYDNAGPIGSRGYHAQWLAWNRALSPAEILQLCDEPWGWAGRPARRLFVPPAVGGSSYNVDLAESLTATDSLSAQLSAAVSLAEAASAADAISHALTAAASLAETGSAADQVSAGAATYAADIAEAANLTDAISSVLTAAASVVESVTATDAVSSLATLLAELVEAVSAADQYASSTSGSTYAVDVIEAANAIDGIAAVLEASGVIAENVSAGDSVSNLAQLAAAVGEAVTALDSAIANGISNVSVSESVSLADAVSSPTGFGDTPPGRTITVRRGDRTITVRLHGRTITVH